MKIKIEIKAPQIFATEMAILISHINYGNHLGNDSVLALVHEARIRFFKHLGASELDLFGTGIILRDAAIQFRGQGHYADQLMVEVFGDVPQGRTWDLYYKLIRQSDQLEIARVQTGIVFFDYHRQSPVHCSQKLERAIQEILGKNS